jgi:hypothetical protein
MEADIKAAIEKNLPSAVGELLQKRLVKADEDAKQLERVQAHNQTLAKKVSDLEAVIKSDEERVGQIKKLQDSIELAKATTHDKYIVELIEKHANEKVELVKSIVNTVFANARLKSTVMENAQIVNMIPGTNGSCGYTTTTPTTSTTVTETEQP